MSSTDLARALWRKSSRSGTNGNCVEFADFGGAVGVRDSKDPAGGVLTFAPENWTAFVDGIRAGEFDLT